MYYRAEGRPKSSHAAQIEHWPRSAARYSSDYVPYDLRRCSSRRVGFGVVPSCLALCVLLEASGRTDRGEGARSRKREKSRLDLGFSSCSRGASSAFAAMLLLSWRREIDRAQWRHRFHGVLFQALGIFLFLGCSFIVKCSVRGVATR